MTLLLALLLVQTPEPPAERLQPLDRTGRVTSWQTEWMPDAALYPAYLADPQTPRTGTKVFTPIRAGKPASIGKKNEITSRPVKIENSIGSSRTIWRKVDYANEEGVDFGVDAAVISRFDISQAWDMDSADYMFGFPIGYRLGRFSARLRPWHLTSHIGDEIISRIGRGAIRYHKEELELGFAYDWTPEIRTYVDAGFGLYIGTPNKRWRAQCGAEWAGEVYWKGPPRTYVAIDVKWRQETDWDTAICIQSGFFLLQGADGYKPGFRIFLETYFGHSPQTQFPEERNLYWGVGFAAGF